MSIDRYAIYFGNFAIHFYGIILMMGVIAAAVMSAQIAKRKNENPEHVWDMLTWVVLAGIVGARLWHVFTPSVASLESNKTTAYYLLHPLDILQVWNGGLGIPGAVIGGAIAVLIYCRRSKLSFGKWADFIAPGLALAQAIGRWGNFVNQELYGLPTTLPWGIYIDPAMRVAPYLDAERFHPLFAYESIWNLANMALLLWLTFEMGKKLKAGDIILVYCIVYPFGRFMLEFLRIDYSPVGGVNINQLIMAIVAICAAGLLIWRHRKGSHQGENAEAVADAEAEDAVEEADSENSGDTTATETKSDTEDNSAQGS